MIESRIPRPDHGRPRFRTLGPTWAAVGLFGVLDAIGRAHAGCSWLPATSALVPLMLPRVGLSLRRALGAASVTESELSFDGARESQPSLPSRAVTKAAPSAPGAQLTGLRGHAQATLLETHAAVCRELCALKAAYGALKNEVAQRAAASQRLDHLAHYDALTNLPNRVLLMDRLTQALTYAKRAGTGVLVMYLDLDRFKPVNDTLGHAAGDRVLAEVGARLAACMRGADTASRLGGDEFVLVCATADGMSDAPQVAARVLQAISAPMDVFGTSVTLGASIGISLSPADGSDAAGLIEKADAAMYCVKSRGRNGFNLYTPEIQAGIERKLKFEAELRAAIERDEFEVHYQPIVDLHTRQINAAEALVRWRHPTRGLIGPREFIPFAEEHGLGAAIGKRVLGAVCGQLKRFSLAGDDEFAISINVSPDQFTRAEFVADVAAALSASATEPRRLSIEVAEKTLAADSRSFAATVRALRALGVESAIDDFGTGSSALADMRGLVVNQLKIDRSFVTEIASSDGDEAITKTIITLAHSLGMRVIAEGVETPEQAQKLRALGSDSLQGFLISQPLPAADFERFACTYGSLKLAA